MDEAEKNRAVEAGDIAFDCIGFDLDGTLLHTGRELAASLNHTLEAGGLEPIAPDQAITMIGGGAGALLRRALERQGVTDPAETDALLPVLIDHYGRHLGSDTDIYPGLIPLLEILRDAGIALAVVTNKNEELSRRLLDIMDLSRFFPLVIGGDTLGPDLKKPKPDMLQFMLRSINSRNALFVGDSEYDVMAAKAAGLPCVAVSFGYATEDLAALGADHIIDHYDALWPLVEDWR